jgi:hypothetical protein
MVGLKSEPLPPMPVEVQVVGTCAVNSLIAKKAVVSSINFFMGRRFL